MEDRRAAEALSAIRKISSPSVPKVRAIRRSLSTELVDDEPSTVLEIAQMFCAAGYRWVGYELVNQHLGTLSSLDLGQVERLGSGIDSWGTVDAFGVLIAGPAWLRHQISDATVRRWARSDDLWWRRAALVASTVLNSKSRGGYGDTQRTLSIAGMLVTDREDMVVKALSWALRSLVPWDSQSVTKFLATNDAKLAPRVKREVNNKLRTGLKNPR